MDRNIVSRAFILGGKYPAVVKKSKAKWKALLWNTRDKFLSEKVMKNLLTALAKDQRTDVIELYGLWDDGHSFSEKDIPFVVGVAKIFNQIAEENPGKTYYFAPFLEHREANPFMNEVFDRCIMVGSKLLMVNNPISGGGQYLYRDGITNEMHADSGLGKPKGDYILSIDGRADPKKGHGNGSLDMANYNLAKEHPNAIAILKWITQDNGKFGPKDSRKRPARDAWLYAALDQAVCHTSTEPAEMTLAKGHLWKCCGEQDSVKPIADSDDNRPAYISAKLQYKKVQLKALNGRVLETVTRSAKYKHGPGYLFRFTRWGFKMAEEAKKYTGETTCELFVDGKSIGKFDPGHRIPGR